ncbi:MAG: hypothetical protein LBG72_06155 [Spirochaetaceae bacterium]|nr:hypothetical protein [Spirochaetaceae bacterium]
MLKTRNLLKLSGNFSLRTTSKQNAQHFAETCSGYRTSTLKVWKRAIVALTALLIPVLIFTACKSDIDDIESSPVLSELSVNVANKNYLESFMPKTRNYNVKIPADVTENTAQIKWSYGTKVDSVEYAVGAVEFKTSPDGFTLEDLNAGAEKTISIRVTTKDDKSAAYLVTVAREPDTNKTNKLTALSVKKNKADGDELTGSIKPAVPDNLSKQTNYTLAVGTDTDSVIIAPTAAEGAEIWYSVGTDSLAKLTESAFTAPSSGALSPGDSIDVRMQVRPQDTKVQSTDYTLTLHKLDTNNILTGLVVRKNTADGDELTALIDPAVPDNLIDTQDYTLAVGTDIDRVFITPIAAESAEIWYSIGADAPVKLIGGFITAPSSGAMASGTSLAVNIQVRPEDPEAQATDYTLIVQKEKRLIEISVPAAGDDIVMSPDFTQEISNYTVYVKSLTTTVLDVEVSASSAGISYSIGGAPYIPLSGTTIQVERGGLPPIIKELKVKVHPTDSEEADTEYTLQMHFRNFSKYEFTATGAVQTWTAPAAGRYKIEVWGARGANTGNGQENIVSGKTGNKKIQYGGRGGYSYGEIDLSLGDTFSINVGKQGQDITAASAATNGGWNGGGKGGKGSGATAGTGGAGGGASDVRFDSNTIDHRIIVAGGGGGSSPDKGVIDKNQVGTGGNGGAGGGGARGTGGNGYLGQGGTAAGIEQEHTGAGWDSSTPTGNAEYQGKNAKDTEAGSSGGFSGSGGGGGGYYGGIANSTGIGRQGGGGGSGYIKTSSGTDGGSCATTPLYFTNTGGEAGVRDGDGLVVITAWLE